jgi:hypothetical protein
VGGAVPAFAGLVLGRITVGAVWELACGSGLLTAGNPLGGVALAPLGAGRGRALGGPVVGAGPLPGGLAPGGAGLTTVVE